MATLVNSNVISPLDLYLSEPNNANAKDLSNRYGRFWISNDGLIHYNDIIVKDITVGHCTGNRCIARVNGTIIPTAALEQLRNLLFSYKKLGYNVHSGLLNNINNYRTSINRTIY
jgi:hypothetical protein